MSRNFLWGILLFKIENLIPIASDSHFYGWEFSFLPENREINIAR